MKNAEQFIVIDDDPINNMLCKISILRVLGKQTKVETFVQALQGITHIKKEYEGRKRMPKTVLFLDINMPQVSGWETLDKIKELNDPIKNNLVIYMISSSIDPKDKRQALEHPMVSGFIEKPLSPDKIADLFASECRPGLAS